MFSLTKWCAAKGGKEIYRFDAPPSSLAGDVSIHQVLNAGKSTIANFNLVSRFFNDGQFAGGSATCGEELLSLFAPGLFLFSFLLFLFVVVVVVPLLPTWVPVRIWI